MRRKMGALWAEKSEKSVRKKGESLRTKKENCFAGKSGTAYQEKENSASRKKRIVCHEKENGVSRISKTKGHEFVRKGVSNPLIFQIILHGKHHHEVFCGPIFHHANCRRIS